MKRTTRLGQAAVLAAAVTLCGCPLPQPHTDQVDLSVCVLDPGCTRALAVGHRGVTLYGPEDTVTAFTRAWDLGADAVEADVRTTLDGVLVLMHDATVDRTTNGTGAVADLTLAEIKTLAVNSPDATVPPGEVPTWAEALAFVDGKMLIDVDIKSADLTQLVTETAAAGGLDQAFFLAGSIAEAQAIKAVDPAAVVMGRAQNEAEVFDFIDQAGVEIVHFDPEFTTPAAVAYVHGAGAKVFNNALGAIDIAAVLGGTGAYQSLVDLGTDLIQTDLLPLLVPFLASVNAP